MTTAEKTEQLRKIDKIVDAAEAVDRAKRACRGVPGFDYEAGAELSEINSRLMRIAQGVEQRFNEQV